MDTELEMTTNASVGVLEATPPLTSASGTSEDRRSRGSSRRWWPGAICCGLYAALAMIVFGHFDSLGPSHMAGSIYDDSIEEVWWLAWTAFAVPHGHDVFLAQWQNYPDGQNFGVNGSMLALGVLFMPITKVFGPIVSWNIALRFALAISASSMCFVLRRWVTWWPAAFVGGLLYGFSAYILANAGNYLFLIFVPLPPVFFLLLHEILVRQKWRPSRVGTLLGVVCFLQFFIWSEVLAGMVFVGVIATVLFLLVNRRRLQEIWRYAVRAFVFGGVVGGVLLLLPGVFTLFGPQNTHGSPTQGLVNDAFPPDLLGSIVPQFQWLSSKGLTAMGTSHFAFASAEYLGIPMIVVLACFAIFLRKPKTMLFTGAMALITFSLSLGSPLWIDGHKTPVPLPWAVFTHLPLFGGYTPVRFSLFTGLFVAAMFAMGLDEVRRRLRAADRPRIFSPNRRAFAASSVSVAVAAVVILPLVPADAVPTTQTNIPSFFTSAAVEAIPEGGVVLSYPYPDAGGPDLFSQTPKSMMLEQAASGMRFKLLGGFGWFPSTGSHVSTSPPPLSPKSVQEILDGAYWNASSEKWLLSRTGANADLRAVLAKYDVDAVILQPQGAEPADVVRYVTATIGCPVYYPDIAVWLHVKQRLADRVPGRDVNTCAGRSAVVPHVLTPSSGQTVSGSTVMIARAPSFLNVVSVVYYLSGGSLHGKLIARGTSTQFGWLTEWNTKTVPNGRYVLRSVAVNDAGASSTSSGVAITVKT